MTRVLTINEHAHGDDSAASPQDAHSYGTSYRSSDDVAVDCRTGGSKAADPLRTPFQDHPPGDADRLVTGFCGEVAGFTLNLPRPPSVNRYIPGLGNKSPCVRSWHKECDYEILRMRPRPQKLRGPFKVDIVFSPDPFGKKFDLDNPIKPLLDYLQRIELTENDQWCRFLQAKFGPTSLGCRVTVRSWVAAP